jgi:hypothetical protein
MATNPAKGNGQTAAKSGAPLSANAVSPEDRKLIKFVRDNAHPIITCLLDAAVTAGKSREYAQMHEWRQLGNDLATLSGAAAGSKPATTMAASA